MNSSSLDITTKYYFWKPGKALFHAVELEAYRLAGVDFKGPILDLGCGDGTFAQMLKKLRLIGDASVSLDYSEQDLGRFEVTESKSAVRGDARFIPLASGSVASVLANGVYPSITTNPERLFGEVHRVLSDNGLVVLTVPTAKVMELQPVSWLLEALGTRREAARSRQRLERRLQMYHFEEAETLCSKLAAADLEVEQVHHYFMPAQAVCANLLTMQPFRIFGLLKLAPPSWGRSAVSGLLRLLDSMIRGRADQLQPEEAQSQAGWLLVVARKQSRKHNTVSNV